MANIFKSLDTLGIGDFVKRITLSIRQFFATKNEMDVVATALTDLDRRKIEASDIPTSLPASGGNADYATSAGNAYTASSVDWSGITNIPPSFTPSSHTHTKSEITDFPESLPANGGNADTLGGRSASDFILKSEHAGDMYEVNDDGTDYCEAKLKWQILPNANPSTNYRFADMIQVPVPSKEVMEKLADCIQQVSTVKLKIGETVFNESHEWNLLHWLLFCSNEDRIVYTTKYLTSDNHFPSIDDDGTIKSPPPVIEISVCYEKGVRYVHITIENLYGRAYYYSSI